MSFYPPVSKLEPDIYKSDNFLVVDLETAHHGAADPTAVNPKAYTILAVWWFQGKLKYTWGTELELQELYEDMAKADYVVAHRGSFELGFFLRASVDTHKIVLADTKTAEYQLLGNLQKETTLEAIGLRHGLGPRKTQYCSKLIRQGICPTLIPKSILLEYCLEDVTRELQVWLKQRNLLIERGLLQAFFTACYVTPALTAVEFEGMHVRSEPVLAEFAAKKKEAEEAETELNAMTGGINFRSGPQVAKFIYEDLGFEQLKNQARGAPHYAHRAASH